MLKPKKLPMVRQLLSFGLLIVLLAVVLNLLNWLPNLLNPHRLKRFSSIDAARKELNVEKIYLPTYMPEDLHLSWPPSDVYAQDTPFPAAIMHFTFKGSSDIGLVIQQAGKKAYYDFSPAIRITDRQKPVSILIKNRRADLASAECDSKVQCQIISWTEGKTIITLTGKVPAREIIKIASSMLSGD